MNSDLTGFGMAKSQLLVLSLDIFCLIAYALLDYHSILRFFVPCVLFAFLSITLLVIFVVFDVT